MAELSDAELISKIINGELDYFTPLVHRYTSLVWVFIRRKVYDSSEVEDLVQQTFMQLYKNLNQFDTKRKLVPYILQIAKNEVRSYFRSLKSSMPAAESAIDVGYEQSFHESEYDVQSILNALPPAQKKALMMASEGFSYKQIAQTMNKPLNTIRTLIRRGRLRVNQNII